MTDLQALTRAVLENPDDDLPRLVLADRLDEAGTPQAVARAELIRCQVELAKSYPGHRDKPAIAAEGWHADSNPGCPACGLLRHEEAVLRKWGARWLPRPGRGAAAFDLRAVGPEVVCGVINPGVYTFSRGFVSAVRVTVGWRDEQPPLHPGACGSFVRACLSAHPIERVTLAVQGHAPEVRVEVLRVDASGGGTGWRAEARAVDPGREGTDRFLLGNTALFTRRREFLGWLADGFFAHVFPQVRWVPTGVEEPEDVFPYSRPLEDEFRRPSGQDLGFEDDG